MECEEKDPICRLCLTSCGRAFENVELVTIEMLGILGLKLNSNINEKPVICKTCSENLQKGFDFKTICLYTEDCINSFRDEGSNVKLDIGDIYLKKNGIENIYAPKYHTVCRLCMEIAEPGCYISLDDEARDTALAKGILARCFSELDLNTTENPIICASCNSSLCSYFDFIIECFAAEEEIKEDCELEAENEESQGQSSKRAPQPCAEDILKYKNGDSDPDIFKNFTDIKFDVCDDNVIYDELKSTKLKHENLMVELHLKREVTESEELDDNKVEKSSEALQFEAAREPLLCEHSYANMNAVVEFHEKKEDGEAELKPEDLAKKETDEFNIPHEELNLKTEEGSAAGNEQLAFESRIEPLCQELLKNNLTTGNVGSLIHLFVFQSTGLLFAINSDAYQGIKVAIPRDDGLRTHKGRGKDVFKQHHKDVSETTHSCEICTYETKKKSSLKRHMLTHKKFSEVTTYACEICTYKAKQKSYLKGHMLTHKKFPEVTTYACEICTYKAKRKSYLKRHMLTHKKFSEVATYACEICTYKAKRKSDLKGHMLTHKKFSEAATYACEICTYKAKRKSDLKTHMLIHKKISEVATYTCEICTYKAKRKSDLKTHMLTHKKISEVTMYSCEICTYKVKQKYQLKNHMMIHSSIPKVIKYSCDICIYKTNLKSHFERHMLLHKNFPKVTPDLCNTYACKGKRNLTEKYKNLSERIRAKYVDIKQNENLTS